jgi:hypothetical protein
MRSQDIVFNSLCTISSIDSAAGAFANLTASGTDVEIHTRIPINQSMRRSTASDTN